MSLLRVVLVDHLRGTKMMVELPDDVPLSDLLPALISRLGLPRQQGLDSVVYKLRHPRTREYLNDSDTLAEAGVQTGEIISLVCATPSDLPPEGKNSQHNYLIKLKRILDTRFDEGELRTLCFYLGGIEYDNLPGEGKSNKVRELIRYLERRNRIAELGEIGRQMRPDISW